MPRSPTTSHSVGGAAGEKRRRAEYDMSRDNGVNGPTKPLTHHQMEMSSRALAKLWNRLHLSLEATNDAGFEHDSNAAVASGSAMPPPAAVASARPQHAGSVDNRIWRDGFHATGTAEDLILHFIAHTEFFDRLSWLVAFCLLSRLDFRYHVRATLQQCSPLSEATEAMPWDPRTLMNDEYQSLFTAYCLAIKWHCDYNVSVRYLTNLLPHSKKVKHAITRTTILTECAMFESLGYDCHVSPEELAHLVQRYALPEEQHWLANLVPRMANGSDVYLRDRLQTRRQIRHDTTGAPF